MEQPWQVTEDDFPAVPAYAWAWLQRSRPVVTAASLGLTGDPPEARFVEQLRRRFDDDTFTRRVVIAAVAEVAFRGRIPQRRPPGAAWDRGLTWWAAALAGVTPSEFEARSGRRVASQPALFDPDRL